MWFVSIIFDKFWNILKITIAEFSDILFMVILTSQCFTTLTADRHMSTFPYVVMYRKKCCERETDTSLKESLSNANRINEIQTSTLLSKMALSHTETNISNLTQISDFYAFSPYHWVSHDLCYKTQKCIRTWLYDSCPYRTLLG